MFTIFEGQLRKQRPLRYLSSLIYEGRVKHYRQYYDCTGRVLKLWNGVGDSSVHSSEVAVCAPV